MMLGGIGYEVLNGVIGEIFFHFSVQLTRQGLVTGYDKSHFKDAAYNS